MCGIVGALGARNIVPILIQGLQRLEYRGYDSCGVAVHDGSGLKRARSTALLAPALAALDAAGVPHTDEILVGPVAESIANCADARKVDAIVMGTRGMTAIGNLVMGSVATRVVHLAHVPVTLVK